MTKLLNFGCGNRIEEDFDNVDLKDFNFNEFPYPIKDNTYHYIYSRMVLEHLRYPEQVLKELHRISKPNAIIEIITPHFNEEGSFAMLGHISYFSETTFKCLTELNETWRNNPQKWEIIELKIIPTSLGKWIFPFLRRPLSLIFRGIQKEIQIKLKVIK